MIKIVHNPNATLRGGTSEDDISLSLEQKWVRFEEEILPSVVLPSVKIYSKLAADNLMVLVPKLAGNLKGAYLCIGPESPQYVFEDGLIRRTKSDVQNKVHLEYGNHLVRKKIIETNFMSHRGFTPYMPGSFAVESLPAAVTRLMYRRFSAVEPGAKHQALFQNGGSYNFHTVSVTDNPDRVFSDFDTSGISIASGVDPEGRYPVMLVTPRHAVCNAHIGPGNGTKYVFRRPNGTYQKVTVISTMDSPNMDDLRVMMFDEDVTGCAIYKTLPSDWNSYIQGCEIETYTRFGGVAGLPLLVRQFNTGINPTPDVEASKNNVVDTNSPKWRVDWLMVFNGKIGSSSDPTKNIGATMNTRFFTKDPLHKFSNHGYPGDSGSPCFLLIPKTTYSDRYEPALIVSYFGPTNGPSYTLARNWINSAIETMSTAQGLSGFSFGTVNLSYYPTYPSIP